MLTGHIIHPGIAIGTVTRLDHPTRDIRTYKISEPRREIMRYQTAMNNAIDQLVQMRSNSAGTEQSLDIMIIDSQIEMIRDPNVIAQVEQMVTADLINVETAYKTVMKSYLKMFEQHDNVYIQDRVTDLKDVMEIMFQNLLEEDINYTPSIAANSIIVAEDITPMMLLKLPKDHIKGVIVREGGPTAHSAILLRAMNIPTMFQVEPMLDVVSTGDSVILDCINGHVIINPTTQQITDYTQRDEQYKQKISNLEDYVNKPSITKDGHKVPLLANISSSSDISLAKSNGAEGIGLYRTEFLYMNRSDFPSEEEQYLEYKSVLEQYPNDRVIIRTLDIGGDKTLSYFPVKEDKDHPFQHRALRLSLQHENIFKTQIRALLRASNYGLLAIMFPMVLSVEDFLAAKQIVRDCTQELKQQQIPIARDIPIGMMVEVPEVATHAAMFAKHADFFSIGSNDLIHFTFATNRTGTEASYQYQPNHPSILRLISNTIAAAHEAGIPVGLCGEMASDLVSAPILLGLGVDTLSMSASSILQTRQLFSIIKYRSMQDMAKTCLKMDTSHEVERYVTTTIEKEMTQ